MEEHGLEFKQKDIIVISVQAVLKSKKIYFGRTALLKNKTTIKNTSSETKLQIKEK